MTDLIRLLPHELQIEFDRNFDIEYQSIELTDQQPRILIAELNATNSLLINVTKELKKLKIESEMTQLNLRNSEEYLQAYKTLKQREEQSKIETDDYQYKILELEHHQRILTSHKEGLKYELKILCQESVQ